MVRKLKLAEAVFAPLWPGVRRRSLRKRILPCVATVLMAGIWAAQPGIVRAAEEHAQSPISIDVDEAKLVQLTGPATTVFVANPDIADVQVPTTPNAPNFIVFGKKAGTTTLYALTAAGTIDSYAVQVMRPTGNIGEAIRKQVPSAKIEVSSAPGGISVTGSARSPEDALRIKDVARQFLGEKDNLILNVSVEPSSQVTLRVRVVEVSRQADKNFGFNWSAIFNNGSIAIGLLTGRAPLNAIVDSTTGTTTSSFGDFSRGNAADAFGSVGVGYKSGDGNVNISALVDALQHEGLITILAEPNLTATSGETANFLAGGEFPVPVSQGLQQVTIQWKRFGVSVDFSPIVLDANRMSIKVRPEVSELTDNGSVVVNSIKIPGLAVRRAETTVELASGQSFAIAGLFQNNSTNTIQQFPWLGDIPVLGTLFRSSRFQRNQSELVIIVTPYLVQPANKPGDLHTPNEGIVFSSDLERILLGRLTAGHSATRPAKPSPDVPRLNGAAGFMLEK